MCPDQGGYKYVLTRDQIPFCTSKEPAEFICKICRNIPGKISPTSPAVSWVSDTSQQYAITPALPGALNSPSVFFPVIGTVADMAKGPSRLGAAEPPILLRPKLAALLRPKVDAGLPLGGPSFLSPVGRRAAPRSPF